MIMNPTNEQKDSMNLHQETGFRNFSLLVVLLGILVVISAYNQYQIWTLSSLVSAKAASAAAAALATSSAYNTSTTNTSTTVSLADVRPKGTPAIYGNELGVRYDDVSADNPTSANQAIQKLAAKDREITLESTDQQRYIKIASEISCEYCCGAQSIIFSNGQPACGCAHSYAMRGVAKYLIKNHGSQFTDDQILEELGKWKVLFFPGIHAQKAAVLRQKGIEVNYINLASNKYRGIEKGATTSGGSMVGGC